MEKMIKILIIQYEYDAIRAPHHSFFMPRIAKDNKRMLKDVNVVFCNKDIDPRVYGIYFIWTMQNVHCFGVALTFGGNLSIVVPRSIKSRSAFC